MSKGHEKFISKVLSRHEIKDLEPVILDHVHGTQVHREAAQDMTDADAAMMTAEQLHVLQEQAYNEAYQQGFQQGQEDGLKAGREQLQQQVAHLEQLLVQIEQPLEDLDQEVVDTLLEMVMTIARHLIRRELKSDPGQVVAVIREGIAALPIATQSVRLFLHPEDAALVRETLSIAKDKSPWEIQEDPVLTRGGCRIVTENSQIDATVESRLAAIVAQFFGDERGEESDHDG